MSKIVHDHLIYILEKEEGGSMSYMLDTSKRTTKLEDIIQNFHDPFVVFNSKMEAVFANSGFYALLDDGEVRDEQILKKLQNCYQCLNFKGKKLDALECPIHKALHYEFIHNGELQLAHKQQKHSTYYYVSTRSITIDKEDEDLYLIIMRDVTNTIQTELTGKEFIQIAAHELRTPITSIKGFTQLVYERYKERSKSWHFQPTINIIKDMERDETFLKIMLDEVHRLDELTDELLSIFKLEQGKLEIEVEETEVTTFVAELIDKFHIPNDFHRIHYDSSPLNKHIRIDKKQIKRVLHNFLSNAVKYSPLASDIYVTVECQDDQVVVGVKDEGFGIPEECQSRIFDRFYRVEHPEHEEIPGYGIGLHICREIIRLHGGDTYFESILGQGSTFYFRIPCV